MKNTIINAVIVVAIAVAAMTTMTTYGDKMKGKGIRPANVSIFQASFVGGK